MNIKDIRELARSNPHEFLDAFEIAQEAVRQEQAAAEQEAIARAESEAEAYAAEHRLDLDSILAASHKAKLEDDELAVLSSAVKELMTEVGGIQKINAGTYSPGFHALAELIGKQPHKLPRFMQADDLEGAVHIIYRVVRKERPDEDLQLETIGACLVEAKKWLGYRRRVASGEQPTIFDMRG